MQILYETKTAVDDFCQRTLHEQENALETGSLTIKAPAPEGLMKAGTGHFHFTPEVFVQLHGETGFECPHERFLLKTGEIGVLAAGLPHLETPHPQDGQWMNMVMMFSPVSVSWHITGLTQRGEIKSAHGRMVQTPAAPRLIGYLTDMVEVWNSEIATQATITRGLMLAFLALLRATMSGATPPATSRMEYKVLQCRHYIQRDLAHPGINVQFLAKRLHCSSDYLSHLFRREMGMTLITFIQQQRVLQARNLLGTSTLNIAEVGQAVGYEDPGYFIRVFKKLTGQTPKEYRNSL